MYLRYPWWEGFCQCAGRSHSFFIEAQGKLQSSGNALNFTSSGNAGNMNVVLDSVKTKSGVKFDGDITSTFTTCSIDNFTVFKKGNLSNSTKWWCVGCFWCDSCFAQLCHFQCKQRSQYYPSGIWVLCGRPSWLWSRNHYW